MDNTAAKVLETQGWDRNAVRILAVADYYKVVVGRVRGGGVRGGKFNGCQKTRSMCRKECVAYSQHSGYESPVNDLRNSTVDQDIPGQQSQTDDECGRALATSSGG
jgi:hypothetical protein